MFVVCMLRDYYCFDVFWWLIVLCIDSRSGVSLVFYLILLLSVVGGYGVRCVCL